MHTLLPHQIPADAYAKAHSRMALYMEMRLGKTIVTMRWARHHQLRRILLLAPWNTLVGSRNWEGELRRDGQQTAMLCLTKTEDRESAAMWRWTPRQSHGSPDWKLSRTPATGWFLLHYEGLRVAPEVLDLPWDAIVVDECTRIRNPSAQITKLLLQANIEHRAILSGLPNPESPLDFFTQFQFLLGHCLSYDNFWAFRQRYFYQGRQGWQWYPKKGTIQTLKEFVHANSFTLTRRAAKVGSKKVYEMRSCAMGPKQARALREIAKKYAYEGQETKWAPVVHTWMQKVAGGFSPVDKIELIDPGKIRLLHDVLTEEFKRESVVVWYRFNHEIDYCYRYLRNKKVSVERVHGGMKMPKTERSRIQDRFQDGKTRVLLMQVALGQFGWDLSRADTLLYYSNTYEFEDRSQSEDRAIHPKKKGIVRVIDLVTIGTSDEDLVEAIRDKKLTSRQFRTEMAASVVARLKNMLRVHPGDNV